MHLHFNFQVILCCSSYIIYGVLVLMMLTTKLPQMIEVIQNLYWMQLAINNYTHIVSNNMTAILTSFILNLHTALLTDWTYWDISPGYVHISYYTQICICICGYLSFMLYIFLIMALAWGNLIIWIFQIPNCKQPYELFLAYRQKWNWDNYSYYQEYIKSCIMEAIQIKGTACSLSNPDHR